MAAGARHAHGGRQPPRGRFRNRLAIGAPRWPTTQWLAARPRSSARSGYIAENRRALGVRVQIGRRMPGTTISSSFCLVALIGDADGSCGIASARWLAAARRGRRGRARSAAAARRCHRRRARPYRRFGRAPSAQRSARIILVVIGDVGAGRLIRRNLPGDQPPIRTIAAARRAAISIRPRLPPAGWISLELRP